MRNRSNNQHSINVERGDLHIHNTGFPEQGNNGGGDGLLFLVVIISMVAVLYLLDSVIPKMIALVQVIGAFWTSEAVLIALATFVLGMSLASICRKCKNDEKDFFDLG